LHQVNSMKIKAELKTVSATKAQSLDIVYKFTFVTEDKSVLALGALPADTVFNIEVNPE